MIVSLEWLKNFVDIQESLDPKNLGAVFAMVFILVGLAFKISAVPFHMWTPDVYEGAPTSITNFFAVVPKIAGLAIFIRFMDIPFKNILDFLKVTPGSTDFTSGLKENNIKLSLNNESIFIEPSICFESIFQTFSFNKINFFVNITNDAWFGKTTGPSQHLAATIFRSVEKGVPLVRSANSGISVIINKNGKILKSKGLNLTGYLQSNISLGNNKTFFMKVGNSSVIFLILIITFFGIIIDLIFKYRKKD